MENLKEKSVTFYFAFCVLFVNITVIETCLKIVLTDT